uniref:t-SNARE coiled-coil homology domain-containing protein n=1 Tax=Fagus sylvatica TaxID=28930 RepID=A0A2N9ID41_FAGSY
MNDLMTKSFLSYVDLKKQAMKDLETELNIEMGNFDPVDEQNLSQFFEEVAAIKSDMEEITNLLLNLQDLNEETKSSHSANVLQGLRDRINSNMVTVLRKAKNIKARLESLDRSNEANRKVSGEYKEGSPIDRTRISVTNGIMPATGEEPSEEDVEKIILGGGQVNVFEGKADLIMENKERHEALKEIQRSLTELHQVFLDMAVLVETQGEQINDIEENVARAGADINGGTNRLLHAKQMKKRKWAYWMGALVLVLLFLCFISILAS